MNDNEEISKWTIDDVLDTNSGFWKFTEDELYDYADTLEPDKIDDFFHDTADLFEEIELNRNLKPKRPTHKDPDGIRIFFTGSNL